MALPEFEIKPGYDGHYEFGKGYSDITDLLRDLHEGILEIAAEQFPNKKPPFILADNEANKLLVLNCDDHRRTPPTFGFLLSTIDNGNPFTGVERWWEFFINIKDFKSTAHKLAPDLQTAFKENRERIYLAILFEAGFSPEQIADRFADPAVRYLREEAKRLAEEQTENSRQQIACEESKNTHRLGILRGNSAALRSQLEYSHRTIIALLKGDHLRSNK